MIYTTSNYIKLHLKSVINPILHEVRQIDIYFLCICIVSRLMTHNNTTRYSLPFIRKIRAILCPLQDRGGGGSFTNFFSKPKIFHSYVWSITNNWRWQKCAHKKFGTKNIDQILDNVTRCELVAEILLL